MKNKEVIFDRRVVEKNVKEGIITRAEYEKFIKSLPDRGQDARWVAIEEIASRTYLRKALGIEKTPPDKHLAGEEESGARKKG